MAKVLVTTRMSQSTQEKLTKAGHTLVFCDATDWREKRDAAQGCAGVACRGGAFPAEFFESLPDLRILALPSAGYDQVDVQSAAKCGVIVTNAGDANAKSVAEIAFLLMLSVAKRLRHNMELAHSGGPWRRQKQMTFTEVSGKTIALLGYGNIACELSQMCSGFGMRVIAYHPRIAQKMLPKNVEPCDDLYYALEQADIVSCHIPAREENVHFINEEAFRHMKQDAIFVNTGRGSVVDEEALVRALTSGHLAGAGLDVFEREPLPKDSPLPALENCVLTPHIGGETAEAKVRVYDMAAENVIRVLAGQEPLSPVTAK